MSFNKDFVWGAATASYQIEGAAFEDGKGLSVWDTYCEDPGRVFEMNHGNVACDHYHRYKEDVQLMKEIGLKAYRMSISWPRVMPNGIGKINEKGLDFYDRLIDELLEKGIDPYVTLFHWDYPYELFKRGAWHNPDSVKWFAEYVGVIVDKLSDRVNKWMTINEPQVFIGHGYVNAKHAPGLKVGSREIIQMAHNVLLGHGSAVQVIRERSKQPCKVGFAPCASIMVPNSQNLKDIEAARKGMFDLSRLKKIEELVWSSGLWMDPVFLGKYPDRILELFGKYLPENYEADLKIIGQELDFFGCNIYSGHYIEAGEDNQPKAVEQVTGHALTGFNWNIVPEALYWGPKFFHERYKKPIIITENGLSSKDWVSLDGKVHDEGRIDFLHRYIGQFKKAAEEGVDVGGYFQWTLMDNFEWAEGYKERFGLIHVDFPTGKRTIKESGYWYKKLIESNGDIL